MIATVISKVTIHGEVHEMEQRILFEELSDRLMFEHYSGAIHKFKYFEIFVGMIQINVAYSTWRTDVAFW